MSVKSPRIVAVGTDSRTRSSPELLEWPGAMASESEDRMHPFRFGLASGAVESRDRWHELARKVEDLGFSTLCVPDHLGRTSTFPALVSAAEATSKLRLGTLVVNNDFHRPLRLAQDVATTD